MKILTAAVSLLVFAVACQGQVIRADVACVNCNKVSAEALPMPKAVDGKASAACAPAPSHAHYCYVAYRACHPVLDAALHVMWAAKRRAETAVEHVECRLMSAPHPVRAVIRRVRCR